MGTNCKMPGLSLPTKSLGTLCVIATILFVPLLILPYLGRENPHRPRANCQNNLKRLYVSLRLYAQADPEGRFPALSPEPGRLVPNPAGFFPDHLSDATALVCPATEGFTDMNPDDTELLDDKCYRYLGYAVLSDEEAEALADAYQDRAAKGLGFDEDLAAPPGSGTGGSDILRRLNAGELSGLDEEAKSRIPVAIERLFHHVPPAIERVIRRAPPGGNVLFLDGEVRYTKRGEWPMTERVLKALKRMDGN